MNVGITGYEIICNLGVGAEEVYQNAIKGNTSNFTLRTDLIKNKPVRIGEIKTTLPTIKEKIYNTRSNQLILKTLELLDSKINNLIKTYGHNNIAIVVATTNSGIEEYESTKDPHHFELGNPALFTKNYLGLNNYSSSISTACSSGIKAFSIAKNLIKTSLAESAIVIGVDAISKLPLFGFDSLNVLSQNQSQPFSETRDGINISEGVGVFILEKNKGLTISGIGETTDAYHATCPDPEAKESIKAIKTALKEANLTPQNIDYINLHGTGTTSNDLMEATAIHEIFKDTIPCSSTKPMTGHCLGAASTIEIGLCCKLLETQNPTLYPHIYNQNYDSTLPKIKLITHPISKPVNNCLCTSFGFGGTNTAIIISKKGEQNV